MSDPTPVPTPTPVPDIPPAVTFDAAQQAEIDRRIAAARKQAEADAKRKVEADAETKRKADEEERNRLSQIAAGEFDKVKTDYETKLTTTAQERDAKLAEITEFESAVTPLIDALKTKLSAEALVDYPETDGAAKRLKWLQTRTALIESLTPVTTPRTGGITPRPNGDPKHDGGEDARKAQSRALTNAF